MKILKHLKFSKYLTVRQNEQTSSERPFLQSHFTFSSIEASKVTPKG